MTKAEGTRMMILQTALKLIYRQGYQATSIDEIIASTAVTKGAFFYHFKSKEQMGLAIINEILYPGMVPYVKMAFSRTGNIRTDLYAMIEDLLNNKKRFIVDYGCPAVNLIEEMAPISASFHKALLRIMDEWQSAIMKAVALAQLEGQLDRSHDAKAIALYVIAGYAGARNMGKMFGVKAYSSFLKAFKNYVMSLE
jgi:AcrR family transcriptional regulator